MTNLLIWASRRNLLKKDWQFYLQMVTTLESYKDMPHLETN